MGKKGKKVAKAAGIAAEVERKKKICLNCGKSGGSGEKNFSKCAFCELTRYSSRDCQKAHSKVRFTRSDSLFNANPNVRHFAPIKVQKEESNRVVSESWFWAATRGRIDEIKRLLKRGIKVDRTTEISGIDVITALSCAAIGGEMRL